VSAAERRPVYSPDALMGREVTIAGWRRMPQGVGAEGIGGEVVACDGDGLSVDDPERGTVRIEWERVNVLCVLAGDRDPGDWSAWDEVAVAVGELFS
jgi:hypothetical protein